MPLQLEAHKGAYRWPQPVARRMTDAIHSEVRQMLGHTRLVRRNTDIALVEINDLHIGPLLGKGGFSQVHAVRSPGNPHTYALKCLKMSLMSQPDNFRLAAAELAVEAHMLASFDHPNILKIRGWAANGVASYVSGAHDAFFLILDQLEETLDARIERWQQEQRPSTVNSVWNLMYRDVADTAVIPTESVEKLAIMFEIASALSYLHSMGVIFRDLKPNNIGFLNGRVQLFDFGLSRELPGTDLIEPFEMSGKVGTLRYMAVEVACHQPYNVSADVFSWAMVSYEICTLQKPFQGWTREMHANLVCGRGARPETENLLSPPLKHLLTAGWDQNAIRRPSMPQCTLECQRLLGQLLLAEPQQSLHIELPQDFTVTEVSKHRHEAMTASTTLSISGSGQSMGYFHPNTILR